MSIAFRRILLWIIVLIASATGSSSAKAQALDPCIGADGLAICTDQQPTAWTYSVSTIETYFRYDYADCVGRGGVMKDRYTCENAVDPTTDAGAESTAQAIASTFFAPTLFNGCGLTGATNHTVWGNLERPWGYGDLCDVPGDGKETLCRYFGFEGGDQTAQGCTNSFLPVYALKSRTVVCPNGFALTTVNGAPTCVVYQCGSGCSAGVNPNTGGNNIREEYFESPNPLLSVSGNWNSQGSYVVPGTAGDPAKARNLGWTTNYESRVFAPVAMAGVKAILHTADGQVRVYGSDGVAMHAWPEGKDRIEYVLLGGAQSIWNRYRVDGGVETYDSNGRLKRVQSRAGQFVDIDRNANGDIQSLVDESGRAVVFIYVAGRLSALDLPDGKDVVFAYDAVGRMTSVQYDDGRARKYAYDTEGQLILVSDQDNVQLKKVTYNPGGVVDKVVLAPAANAGAGISTQSFTASGDSRTYTDANGKSVTRTYVTVGGLRKRQSQSAKCEDCSDVKTILYAANGYPEYETRFDGSMTKRVFDALGRETERSEGLDGTANWSCPSGSTHHSLDFGAGCGEQGSCWATVPFAGSKNGATIGWPNQYYSCMIPPTLASMRKVETSWFGNTHNPSEVRVYDDSAALVAKQVWTYNSRGQVLTASQVDPVTAVLRTTTYAYCEAADVAAQSSTCPIIGRPKSVDGPLPGSGDAITYLYRPADDQSGCAGATGNCHRKGDLWKVRNVFGHETSIDRYDMAGRPVQSRDANLVQARTMYDARGRVLSQTTFGPNPDSTTDDAAISLAYNSAGQVGRITQPDGAFVDFTYDEARRLVRIQDNLGNAISYVLDAAGHRITEETRDAGGTLTSTLSRLYNQLGQMATQADAQLNPTDFTYALNGNIGSLTDALERTTTHSYDALGRLRESIANAGGTGAERAQTSFEYDALDRLSTVTDPKGLLTRYSYDGFGNLIGLSSPDTGVTNHDYDLAGNRIRKVDARGIETVYAYDATSRLTLVRSNTNQPGGGNDLAAFTYDAMPTACTVGETFNIGRLSSFNDPSGSTVYCHDRRGNVVRKVQGNNGGQDRSLTYGYTAADRVSSINYPSGLLVTYTRNAAGQITGVSARTSESTAPISLVNSAQYLPFGPIKRLVFGNGRLLDRNYDLDYDIVSVADSAANGMAIGYAKDDVGNVVGLSQRQNGGAMAARTIDYDGLDRLVALKNGAVLQQGFTYDATGNRTSKTTTTTESYTYPATNHRLSNMGSGTSRTYDAAGNMLTMRYATFTYDDLGRMASVVRFVTGASQNRNYRYNALGQRVAKIHPTQAESTVFYVYDESGKLMGEYTPAGTLVREYIWLDDTLIATRSGYAGQLFQYVLTDHLNTPRAVVLPSTNAIIWRWDVTSTAFGEHLAQSDPDGDTAHYFFNLRYPGQYFDSETGLHYNYFRDYDPSTGRYVQSDLLGIADGPATYLYGRGNPLRLSDVFGLATFLGFDKNQEALMRRALGEAVSTMKACTKCMDCGEDGRKDDYCIDPFERQDLISDLQNAQFEYHPQTFKGDANGNLLRDAAGKPIPAMFGQYLGGNRVAIYPIAFTQFPCSLATLLAHEVGHGTFSHEQIYNYEFECFNCNNLGW